MLNDFLPAIVSVAILAGAFLFVWSSDVRRAQRADVPDLGQDEIGIEGTEPLSISTDIG